MNISTSVGYPRHACLCPLTSRAQWLVRPSSQPDSIKSPGSAGMSLMARQGLHSWVLSSYALFGIYSFRAVQLLSHNFFKLWRSHYCLYTCLHVCTEQMLSKYIFIDYALLIQLCLFGNLRRFLEGV